jgi:hypothetical protein
MADFSIFVKCKTRPSIYRKIYVGGYKEVFLARPRIYRKIYVGWYKEVFQISHKHPVKEKRPHMLRFSSSLARLEICHFI